MLLGNMVLVRFYSGISRDPQIEVSGHAVLIRFSSGHKHLRLKGQGPFRNLLATRAFNQKIHQVRTELVVAFPE